MSDNPYAQSSGISASELDLHEPERTSVMAIGSLITSLTCCLSPLGLLLGIGSLVGISGSKGRVGGKGLAIAGLVIGALGTALLLGAWFGTSQVWSLFRDHMLPAASKIVVNADDGDFDAVRAQLTSPSNRLATDEVLEAFRTAYREDLGLGAYQGYPEGFFEFMGAYGKYGPGFQKYQGRNDMIPLPATFANGEAMIIVFFDQAAQQRSGQVDAIPVVNIAVILPDGTERVMLDPVMIQAARDGRLEEVFPDFTPLPEPVEAEVDDSAEAGSDGAADDGAGDDSEIDTGDEGGGG